MLDVIHDAIIENQTEEYTKADTEKFCRVFKEIIKLFNKPLTDDEKDELFSLLTDYMCNQEQQKFKEGFQAAMELIAECREKEISRL